MRAGRVLSAHVLPDLKVRLYSHGTADLKVRLYSHGTAGPEGPALLTS